MSVLAEHQPREGRRMSEAEPARRKISIRVYRPGDEAAPTEPVETSIDPRCAVVEQSPTLLPPCRCPRCRDGQVIAP